MADVINIKRKQSNSNKIMLHLHLILLKFKYLNVVTEVFYDVANPHSFTTFKITLL